MTENEEIIALLNSINKHLEELDASMLAMKKRIDHIDDRLIQEDMDNEAAALMQLEEGYEKPVDPQFEVIFKKLTTINENIVQADQNEEIREKNILYHIDGFRDEQESYFNERTRQISQIISMLKSIHIWHG